MRDFPYAFDKARASGGALLVDIECYGLRINDPVLCRPDDHERRGLDIHWVDAEGADRYGWVRREEIRIGV